MADAIRRDVRHERDLTSAAAVASGEIHQMPDGRAGVYTGINAAASGDLVGYSTEGVFTVTKNASTVFVDGQQCFWDHSANEAVHAPSLTDRDFFIGSVVGDAASTDTTMLVNLNVKPTYIFDMAADPYDSVVVLTAGTAQVRNLGGAQSLEFSATAEAQKVDILSKQGFALGSNWILEGSVEVVDDGDDAALDFNIGVASGTHATSADTIAESVFLHTDGNVVNILAESDDGTNEQAATDTTIDYTLGTAFHFVMDGRDPTDVQIYINGVLALGAKTFNVSDGSGPLYALAHLEKTSNDTPGEFHVNYLRVRTGEV